MLKSLFYSPKPKKAHIDITDWPLKMIQHAEFNEIIKIADRWFGVVIYYE